MGSSWTERMDMSETLQENRIGSMPGLRRLVNISSMDLRHHPLCVYLGFKLKPDLQLQSPPLLLMLSSILCWLSHLLLFGDVVQREVFPGSWEIEAVRAPHHLFLLATLFF